MSVTIDDTNSDSIVRSVIQSFLQRSKIGKEKYKTTLDRDDLTLLEWIQHCQEEYMDSILYLEKIKKVLNDSNDITDTHPDEIMTHLLTTKMKNILSDHENEYPQVIEDNLSYVNIFPKLFYYFREFITSYQLEL